MGKEIKKDDNKHACLFENLELPKQIKEELSESFNDAVLIEAVKLAESKEKAYEEYMMAQITEMKEELEDTLDAYLEKVVEQFIEDNTFAMDESIKSEKYDAILEGFNSLMIATGVEAAQIAGITEKIEGETNESAKALADKLMAENIELKEKNAELLKTGLVKESAEDMTAVQRDKFFKLAKVVEFDASAPVDFINKMDTLAESVKGEKAQKVKEKVIVENVSSTYVTKASHLF